MHSVLIVSYATSMYMCVLHRPKAIDIDKLIDRYRWSHIFLYLCFYVLPGDWLWSVYPVSAISAMHCVVGTFIVFFPPSTAFSIVCLVILHCLAMSSSSNPPLSCWTVDWTPHLSSTSCPFLSCTGKSPAPAIVSFIDPFIDLCVVALPLVSVFVLHQPKAL